MTGGLALNVATWQTVAKWKAAGIEPASCTNLAESPCNLCENCQHARAARALHSGGPDWHFMSSLDANLQSVIAAWDGLPAAVRMAIRTLLDCGKLTRARDLAIQALP
jgi:hypothetical protein